MPDARHVHDQPTGHHRDGPPAGRPDWWLRPQRLQRPGVRRPRGRDQLRLAAAVRLLRLRTLRAPGERLLRLDRHAGAGGLPPGRPEVSRPS